ncbi:MAG: ABC transporter ATP-binding protein [Alphaproteobacteria bacterium]|nr:ABC transporter ATP-binding protein [Alphaproteobacteria bacterium]
MAEADIPLITLDNVTVQYGRHTALQDVSGAFGAGSLTAVAGINGSGKSTLLKVIAGVVKPSMGRVTLCEKCAPQIAYLPQTSTIQRDFPISVLQAVVSGFWRETGSVKRISENLKNCARAALAEVGLAGFEERQISALSGGQFQRLLFARLILQDAQIILLDEPFAAVDSETTARLIQILLNWHKEGRTIICVLHDLLMIRKYFPESFLLAGKCLGRGHTHALFDQKLLSFDLDMAELLGPGPNQNKHNHHDHS